MVCGFSLVLWVIYGFLWEVFSTCKELSQERWLSGAKGPYPAVTEDPSANVNGGQATTFCQTGSCGCTQFSLGNTEEILIQHVLYDLEPIVFSLHLCKSKLFSEHDKVEHLILEGWLIGLQNGLKKLTERFLCEGWANEQLFYFGAFLEFLMEVKLLSLFNTPYNHSELPSNELCSCLHWKYELFDKLAHNRYLPECYPKVLNWSSKKIPAFCKSFWLDKIDSHFQSSSNVKVRRKSFAESINCKVNNLAFGLGCYFDVKGRLESLVSPSWGLVGLGGSSVRLPLCEYAVWVASVNQSSSDGGGGQKKGEVVDEGGGGDNSRLAGGADGSQRANEEGEARGTEGGANEGRVGSVDGGALSTGVSLPKDEEYCQHLLIDNYVHPVEGIFYVPTNVCGPGVPPEDFDSLYVGCSCSVGSLICNANGLKCACVARSLGPNYSSEGLLTNEKLRGDRHLPVFECGEACGCSLNCGNRRVQFGPLASLRVFETAVELVGRTKVVEDDDKMLAGCHENCPEVGLVSGGHLKGRNSTHCERRLSEESKGLGLQTLVFVRQGSFVCEYAGEVIGRDEAIRRWRKDSSLRKANYILSLVEWCKKNTNTKVDPSRSQIMHSKTYSCHNNEDEGCDEKRASGDGNYRLSTYIDPTQIGNIGRYANHSCNPNTVAIGVRIQGPVPHLCLFAARDLCPGEEITFDYAGMDRSDVEQCSDKRPKSQMDGSSFEPRRKTPKLDGCSSKNETKGCDSPGESITLEQISVEGSNEMIRTLRPMCDKLPSHFSGQICLKKSSFSLSTVHGSDIQPAMSQVQGVNMSDSEKVFSCDSLDTMLESIHESEMTRTPCLCREKNCRRFLPFSELWI